VRRLSWDRVYRIAVQAAWILFFITLPATSFPYFPADIGGRTLVRPLAAYPLAILMVLLIIPRLFKKPLPRTFLPLLAFTLIALISAVFAFTSDLDAFRGVTPVSRLVRNLISLGLGLSFYFTVSMLHESWEDLNRSLRWLLAGMGLALLWGTLQIPNVIFSSPTYFKIVNHIQRFISTRKLFSTRISGMTFEPKWFAEQICFILLPWLIASLLTNRSAFRWRWHKITIEIILLVWSIGVLFFTFSRTGFFVVGLLAVIGYFLYHYRFGKKTEHIKKPIGRRILEASTLIVVLGVAVVIIGSQNNYFSRLWRYWTEAKTRNRSYLEFIAVEQRFVYLETALRINEVNPLLGVGLGNYAFYFDQKLPNRPWQVQQEIMRQITPGEGRDRLITPKNLIARLIAETGVLGTGAFMTFVLAIVGCMLYLWFSPGEEQKFWGVGALLALIVFLFEIFSFDSFAIPNMWIVFGLITAAAHLPDHNASTIEEPVSPV
jgi:hypothetical protein